MAWLTRRHEGERFQPGLNWQLDRKTGRTWFGLAFHTRTWRVGIIGRAGQGPAGWILSVRFARGGDQ